MLTPTFTAASEKRWAFDETFRQIHSDLVLVVCYITNAAALMFLCSAGVIAVSLGEFQHDAGLPRVYLPLAAGGAGVLASLWVGVRTYLARRKTFVPGPQTYTGGLRGMTLDESARLARVGAQTVDWIRHLDRVMSSTLLCMLGSVAIALFSLGVASFLIIAVDTGKVRYFSTIAVLLGAEAGLAFSIAAYAMVYDFRRRILQMTHDTFSSQLPTLITRTGAVIN